jgi:hypothetical protein
MIPSGQWTLDLANTIYPPDAEWLFNNIRSMHLAFVTPADDSEEFILTDNAFSIFEGPVSFTVDRFTGKETLKAHSEFHLLNVISPQLAMILRENHMPEPLEDMDVEIRNMKKTMLAVYASMHTDPKNATFLLYDLPVAKARYSYTIVSDGRLVLAEGADGIPCRSDRFHFLFFRIQSRHVQMINTVMLDQAHNISKLVYRTESGLRKALEFFLDYPIQAKGQHSLKTVTHPENPRIPLLRKLEQVADMLGSNVKAKYHLDFDPLSFDEAMVIVLKTAEPIRSNHPLDIAMIVMVSVIEKMQMNIRAIHALDHISKVDCKPSYPEIVFNHVRQANPADLNQYTKILPTVNLQIWMMGWDGLVRGALQRPEADFQKDIDCMQEQLDSLGPEFMAGLRQTAARENDARIIRRSLGLSKRGVMKAFDAIGRDDPPANIDPVAPTAEAPILVPRHEASHTSSHPNDAKEELLLTLEKIEGGIDMRAAPHNDGETSVFGPQLDFIILVAVLFGAIWWVK